MVGRVGKGGRRDANTVGFPDVSTALITPSFRGDFERCRLLLESVQRFVPTEVSHHVVVDRRDVALFEPVTGGRTQLCVVEDVVPRWLRRAPTWMPFGTSVWLNGRGRPVRNWMLQQIVKLSTNVFASADEFIFVDSDVFFVAPWKPETGSTLFREEGPEMGTYFNTDWHHVAHRLLGLEAPTSEQIRVGYVGNLLSWRRDVLEQLQMRLQQVSGRHWVQCLTGLPTLSEYVLYGVFVERVLGFEAAGQAPDNTIACATEWGTVPLGVAELEQFRATIAPHQVSAMISAKSGTDVAAIRQVFMTPAR